jgi:hypothetical protein
MHRLLRRFTDVGIRPPTSVVAIIDHKHGLPWDRFRGQVRVLSGRLRFLRDRRCFLNYFLGNHVDEEAQGFAADITRNTTKHPL